MTNSELLDPDLDQWLDHGLNALTEAVGAVLDIDSGLRDARLPAHHRSVETALDTVVDIDAGLQAILPQTTNQSDPQLIDHTDSTDTSLRTFVQNLANRPLQERLELLSRIPSTASAPSP